MDKNLLQLERLYTLYVKDFTDKDPTIKWMGVITETRPQIDDKHSEVVEVRCADTVEEIKAWFDEFLEFAQHPVGVIH